MMECSEARECLSCYLDGELSEEESFQVAAHLDSCGPCAGEFHRLTEMAFALGQLGAIEPPAGLSLNIAAAVADEQERDETPYNIPLLLGSLADEIPPADLRSRILAATTLRPNWKARLLDQIRGLWTPAPARWALGGAAATLAVVAVLSSRVAQPPLPAVALTEPAVNAIPYAPRKSRPVRVAARSAPKPKPAVIEAEWKESITLPHRRMAESRPVRLASRPASIKASHENLQARLPKPNKRTQMKDDLFTDPVIEPPAVARIEQVPAPAVASTVPDTDRPQPPAVREAEPVKIVANISTLPKDPLADLRESLKQARPNLSQANLSEGPDRKITISLVKTTF
ncbi:MAG: zf-HC2 domain-containing protein [Armatimonadetes bacterium]|nr:zf-HC2 domain-containing protein [Armatimonadota bacterium]